MEPITGCRCPLSGHCSSHNVNKSAHMHKLCQSHTGYFNMWENCVGPGQNPNTCSAEKPEVQPTPVSDAVEQPMGDVMYPPTNEKIPAQSHLGVPSKPPGMIQKAKNFAAAAQAHARSGFATVDSEQQQRRLNICKGCPQYDAAKDSCRACGCPLKRKSLWKTSQCPLQKWDV